MPTTTTVRPILVNRRPLSAIEQEWDIENDEELGDIGDDFDNLRDVFFDVCQRLRKEVRKHKETKRQLAELQHQTNSSDILQQEITVFNSERGDPQPEY